MLDFKPSKRFEKAVKKLVKGNVNLTRLIAKTIDDIRTDPLIGDLKKGDLKGIRCLDFYYNGTNYELAYDLEEDENGNYVLVLLLLVGTRENFYEELKRFL